MDSDRHTTRILLTRRGGITVVGVLVGLVAAAVIIAGLRPNGQAPRQLRVGVDLASGFYEPSAVSQFSSLVGRRVSIVQNFVSWEYTTDPGARAFPTTQVRQILAQGSEPEITWDPTLAGGPVNQPQIALAAIIKGRFDSYIRSFAEAAAAVDQPFLIRLAHEMNGTWTSYFVGNSGNRPGDFVKAWRHVYDIFASVGAEKVQWVWSPNAAPASKSLLAALYPGDRYVDWVGLDGYSYPKAGCKRASQIFDPALADIARFSDRPEMLAEVGISASCPGKATLVRELFDWLKVHPRIRALTWWQRNQQGEDWEINSSRSSLEAFRQGIGAK